ncbi:hypothetical protein GCM10027277_42480 [Pseudoduganella ginsengisoli]
MPQLPLPQLPTLQDRLNSPLLRDTQRLLDRSDIADLRSLRLKHVTDLLQRHRDVLEADPHGNPVVRHEILAWQAGSAGVAAAQAAGLSVTGGDADGVHILRLPAGADIAATLQRLRAADPDGVYDYNHIYTGSGAAPAGPQSGAGKESLPPGPGAGAAKVGLVDSGIDRGHEVFADAAIQSWGCEDGSHPSAHGTAVAALMVGRSARFRGAAPQAALYAADIYCDSGSGGSAARIAAALAWLAREHVAVINVSLVGPPNLILEKVVRDMVQRGHLLVAAVGNDGPAAPPLYPASYAGVVGVSGVDRQGRPLPEAARGPQVMFAAPGSQMVSAAIGAPPYRTVRGTSYAAPLVAALLSLDMGPPSPQAARSALDRLARSATGVPPGAPSNTLGQGIVGASLRVDPSSFK